MPFAVPASPIAQAALSGTGIRVEGLEQARAVVKHVIRRAWLGCIDAADTMAQIAQLSITNPGSTERVGLEPPAHMTLVKRRLGKRAGIKPAIPTSSSTVSLKQSGVLQKHILVRRPKIGAWTGNVQADIHRERRLEWSIAPDGRAKTTGPNPISIAKLMLMLETGYVLTVPMTRASAAYLKHLYAGTAGPPGGPASKTDYDNTSDVGVITTYVPPRPIFQRVYETLARDSARRIGAHVERFIKVGGALPALEQVGASGESIADVPP